MPLTFHILNFYKIKILNIKDVYTLFMAPKIRKIDFMASVYFFLLSMITLFETHLYLKCTMTSGKVDFLSNVCIPTF